VLPTDPYGGSQDDIRVSTGLSDRAGNGGGKGLGWGWGGGRADSRACIHTEEFGEELEL
jgi:hypothetical protein